MQTIDSREPLPGGEKVVRDPRRTGGKVTSPVRSLVSAVLVGGSAVAVLDGLDAIAAFGLVLGLDPVQIYQYVASGMLGPDAFTGGVPTALLGVAVHCLIAVAAASAFSFAALRAPRLVERPALSGSLFGVSVFVFMNYVVTPLSLAPPSEFSLPLFLNGVLGHVVFVGLPIAYAARRYLGHAPAQGGRTAMSASHHAV